MEAKAIKKMNLPIKHLGLIFALLSVICSFYFFGRKHDIYERMLIFGLLFSLIFFLIILISKGTRKSKFISFIIVLVGMLVNYFTETFLIKSSHLVFIEQNSSELNSVTSLLKNKTGEIYIFNDHIKQTDSTLTNTEKKELIKLRNQLDIYYITKNNNTIQFILCGFLDSHIGIAYNSKNTKPNENFRKIKDYWFF